MICTSCKIDYPSTVEYFYQRKNRNQLNYSECKACFKNRIANRARAQKNYILDKLGGKCKICGYNKFRNSLEAHHISPLGKDFALSKTYLSREKLDKELSKCILVCSNCHREIHGGLHPEFLAN